MADNQDQLIFKIEDSFLNYEFKDKEYRIQLDERWGNKRAYEAICAGLIFSGITSCVKTGPVTSSLIETGLFACKKGSGGNYLHSLLSSESEITLRETLKSAGLWDEDLEEFYFRQYGSRRF